MIRTAIGIFLVLAVIFTASAYAVRNGNDSIRIAVPEVVQQKVRELFPNAADIEWERAGKGNYEAEFVVNERSVEMLLDEKGNVLELQKEVDHAELPGSIKAELEKKNLTRLARAMYVKKGNEETYRLVGLTGDKRLRMTYDMDGKLLSENVIDRNKKQQAKVNVPSGGLSAHSKKWDLPFVLKEISGIALIDDKQIACVQDETGSIFIYDLEGSKIVREISFGEPGDHEGIALVNNDAWVLRSDGLLYEVKNYLSAKAEVQQHKLQFAHAQNLEGLCYDKANNRLLIAPREYDTENTQHKGFYSFDLSKKKLSGSPLFRIQMEDPLLSEVDPKPGKAPLMPSAIAIHPVTGKIYITDARNSQVLITDKKGKPEKLIQLNISIHPKTEGITFTPSGDIYLSNEGKKQSPNIVLLEKGALQ